VIVACASDDGIHFIEQHFGEAQEYGIYEVNQRGVKLIEVIKNTSEEEEVHKDPKKARQIMTLLMEANVTVGLTKVFGPNISRIREKIVPVLVSCDSIESGLQAIRDNYDLVEEAIHRKENRTHIDLRKRSKSHEA